MQFSQIDSYPASAGFNGRSSLRGSPENAGRKPSAPEIASSAVQAEYLEDEKLSGSITMPNGDTATFSLESLSYGKVSIDAGGADAKKITDYIGKDFASALMEWKKRLLDEFSGKKSDGTQDASGTAAASDDLAIPEYWNAENTSSRIVNFAVSFYGSFSGAGSDFLAKIKDAIEQGFKEAGDVLGDLPGKVASLVSDTHDLVMKKLDAWASENGIVSGDDTGSSSQA